MQRVIATERDATKMKRLITQWSRDTISHRRPLPAPDPTRLQANTATILNNTLLIILIEMKGNVDWQLKKTMYAIKRNRTNMNFNR